MDIMRIPDESEWMSSNVPRFMLRALQRPGDQGLISRELRLFACACVRQVGELLVSEHSRRAVDLGERYAEGEATSEELKVAHDNAKLAEQSIRQRIKQINSETQTSCGRPITEEWMWVEIEDWHPEGRRLSAAEAASLCAHTLILTSNVDPEVKFCGDWNLALGASTRAHDASADRESLEAQEAKFLADDDYLLYEDGRQADLLRCIFGNPFRQYADNKLEIELCMRDLAESIYRLRDFDKMPDLGKELEACGNVEHAIVAHCLHDHVHARGCWALDTVRGLHRNCDWSRQIVRSSWMREYYS